MRLDDIAAIGGDYVLVLRISSEFHLEVGQMGALTIPPGWALYVGSARGPGGLRARLARHARPAELKSRHWHIDYLTNVAPIREMWLHPGNIPSECRWAEWIHQIGQPVMGFGSSDCACAAHLFTMVTYARVNQVWTLLAMESQAELSRLFLR